MKKQPHNLTSSLPNLKFVSPDVLRTTVEGKDFCFVPGTEYGNLPNCDYLFSLWKQGFFEEVKPVDKGEAKNISN